MLVGYLDINLTIIRHLSVCKIIKVNFSSHIEIFQKLNLRRDTRNIELSELSATVESASEEGEINSDNDDVDPEPGVYNLLISSI